MKIVTYSIQMYDYHQGYAIWVDGKPFIEFFEGEPEDASLCRDYSGVYSIVDLVRMAHNAGAETLTIDHHAKELTSEEYEELSEKETK